MALSRGDRVKLVTGGGGGFGDPRLRPAEKVAADVRDGYYSRSVARDAYGVVLTGSGEVDRAATERLRGLRMAS
jgi:N-methylhydantoinase B